VAGGFAEVMRRIAHVQGWLGRHEAQALYEAARLCTGRGVIVEIGSWKGKSTICLASGSRDGAGARVYAIDLHGDTAFAKFERNIEKAGLRELVQPIRASSQDPSIVIPQAIELLFVDGAHDEATVTADFERWVPKVVEGGTVLFHDTVWLRGPRRLVGKRLYRSREFAGVRFIRPSTSMGRKVTRNRLSDRISARAQLAKKTLFWLVTAPAQRIRTLLPRRARRAGRRIVGI
jgi:predicted O-methyltransferase YrrM